MPSVSLWASSAEILFLICEKEKPAGFSFSLFHGKGRNGKRQLAAAGSLRGNEPSQALRASSPEGRAKTVEGAFLVSFSKGYQGHTGSASCLSLWERWMRPTGADGEGAPAPLRGAAAAAAEGPANRRSAKIAFSEAASIFPLRQLLWGLKGASSPWRRVAAPNNCSLFPPLAAVAVVALRGGWSPEEGRGESKHPSLPLAQRSVLHTSPQAQHSPLCNE